MAFDPAAQGWPCRALETCDGQWFTLGDTLVCQCRWPRCRRVIAVVTATPPPHRLSPRALDALQSTDNRPAHDWPGCRD